MARIGIVVFPGSNCDRDVHYILNNVLHIPSQYVWHTDRNLSACDCVIIPGGFAYGDRLRAGAIAAHSPVCKRIEEDGEGWKNYPGHLQRFSDSS